MPPCLLSSCAEQVWMVHSTNVYIVRVKILGLFVRRSFDDVSLPEPCHDRVSSQHCIDEKGWHWYPFLSRRAWSPRADMNQYFQVAVL
jgi:hypothetical protein